MDDKVVNDIFNNHRPYLFAVAYRMLGSVMDAEDIVQEAYLRWQQVALAQVDNPKAFLTTIVSRLCIDQLRSARERREQYIGPWLPEPLLTDRRDLPAAQVALADSLSLAFLLLLERLSPAERAAFLLRKVFAFEYNEIASVLDKSEAACRQLVSRAGRRLGQLPVSPTAVVLADNVPTRQFFQAVTTGDVAGVLSLLAADAVALSDGGGQVIAARRPIVGAERVARFFLGLGKQVLVGYQARFVRVNGQPGMIGYIGQRPFHVVTLQLNAVGQITRIDTVLNPEKLSHIPSLSELETAV